MRHSNCYLQKHEPVDYTTVNPRRYTVIEDEQDAAIRHKFPCSQEQRLHIEAVIQSGIQHICQENADWVSRYIPEIVESGYCPPSQWFN
jgi:hypothetical protein